MKALWLTGGSYTATTHLRQGYGGHGGAWPSSPLGFYLDIGYSVLDIGYSSLFPCHFPMSAFVRADATEAFVFTQFSDCAFNGAF